MFKSSIPGAGFVGTVGLSTAARSAECLSDGSYIRPSPARSVWCTWVLRYLEIEPRPTDARCGPRCSYSKQ